MQVAGLLEGLSQMLLVQMQSPSPERPLSPPIPSLDPSAAGVTGDGDGDGELAVEVQHLKTHKHKHKHKHPDQRKKKPARVRSISELPGMTDPGTTHPGAVGPPPTLE